MILEKAIKNASKILKKHNIISHQLDAQIILSDIMNINKEYLIINDQKKISKKIKLKYDYFWQGAVKSQKNDLIQFIFPPST